MFRTWNPDSLAQAQVLTRSAATGFGGASFDDLVCKVEIDMGD
jgi:hypothetical protein